MRARAFLSSRDRDPEIRLGEAAEAGVWPFEHEAFVGIRAFLEGLVEG